MRKAVSGIILFFSLLPGFLFCAEKEVDLGFLLQKGELIYPDLKKKFYELQHARAREDEVFARRLPDLDVNRRKRLEPFYCPYCKFDYSYLHFRQTEAWS
jgi:hypothetical protein